MLSKETIRKKIRSNTGIIRQHGINRIGLFGSYVFSHQHEGSDIDLLIDFEEGKETFDNFMDFSCFMDELFVGDKVKVLTINGLSPYIGPHILKEVEYIDIGY